MDLLGSTCFFLGSHLARDELAPLLDEAIERHITAYGASGFVVGHYGNFDRLAAAALRRAKERHPDIDLRLLIPYHPFDRPVEPPPGFDGTYYPEGLERVPRRLAIVHADRLLIRTSQFLIAHPGLGQSRELTDYALRREKRGLIRVELLERTRGQPPA